MSEIVNDGQQQEAQDPLHKARLREYTQACANLGELSSAKDRMELEIVNLKLKVERLFQEIKESQKREGK